MPKPVQIPPPDLVLAIDLGASKTKAIAQYYANKDEPLLLCMEPEVADVSCDSLKDYEATKTGQTDPENTCWVGIGNEYHAIGFLAQHKYGGNSLLKELKYACAIPKICGALWVLKQKLKLESKFSLALTVLLPPSEYQDKEALESKLKAATSNFMTPTGEMKVKILLFEAKPEGAGMYLHRLAVLGAEIKQRTMAIAMIGYRNASVLLSVRGAVSPGLSSNFGLSWMVDAFVRRVSGLAKEDPRLVPAIVEAGPACCEEPLTRLVRKKSALEIQAEATKMALALKLSRDDYVRALVRWLSQQLPPETDEIIFCGGTAEYLQPELLKDYSHLCVIWNAGIEISPKLDTAGMGSRIADVLALYKAFSLIVNCLVIKKDGPPTNQNVTAIPRSLVTAAAQTNGCNEDQKKPKGFAEMPDKL